ncbi:RHS repeat-associated core domain-containing protein, partial [Pseudomonas sp. ES1]|uniref:RHS repeat-associated core domain-containing protein n=1 Tax=Pseudomonas sp. ES1 TaxID=3424775 RepID=UPI003D349523
LRKSPIRLHKVPDWSQREYDFEQDPLWHTEVKPQAFEAIAWYHCDHLGTPMELTDEQGNVAWTGEYKAWGEVREERSEWAKQHGLGNPIRFQGQYQDHETGLHYNRHRYYDPIAGRFVSQDPIGLAGGLNFYHYAPNPIDWLDPLGLNRFKKGSWGPCNRGTGLTYTVYQQNIDWDMEHKGKTNLQRAMEGGAPYMMKNGVPQQLQLHHSRQQSIGPLFEVTTSTHRAARGRGREALHAHGNKKNPDFPVDRNAFDIDRGQYWKDRAAEVNKSRRGGCSI